MAVLIVITYPLLSSRSLMLLYWSRHHSHIPLWTGDTWALGKLKTPREFMDCWCYITFYIMMFTIKVTVLWNLRPQTNVPLDQRQASANVKPAGDLGSYVFLRWPHPLFALLAKTKIPLTYWGDQGYTLTYRPNQGRNHASSGIIWKVFLLATVL